MISHLKVQELIKLISKHYNGNVNHCIEIYEVEEEEEIGIVDYVPFASDMYEVTHNNALPKEYKNRIVKSWVLTDLALMIDI